jgi:hypothetical protein
MNNNILNFIIMPHPFLDCERPPILKFKEMDDINLDIVDVDSIIGHAGATLDDIISDYNLKQEHLQRVCSQNVRLRIAKELTDWKMLGHYLKLTEADLIAIKRENDTEALRRVAMLNTWHEREGYKATYLKLAGALYEHGRRDLVGLLCCTMKVMDSMPRNRNEAMFRANEEHIKIKFTRLIQSVTLALEENNVTAEDVRTILVGMFANSDDYIPNTNLKDMITAVSKGGFWNYMHHSPVEELLCNLLPHHRSLISQYKEHLSGYEATTTLINYIKYKRVDSRGGSNELPLGNYTDRHYQRLIVKLDNERNLTLLSLTYVQELWKRFAEEFHIPSLTALINEIDRGCIEITWLVPSDMGKMIATSANKSIRFFRENNIVHVTLLAIEDKPKILYDQLEVCKKSISNPSSNQQGSLSIYYTCKGACSSCL